MNEKNRFIHPQRSKPRDDFYGKYYTLDIETQGLRPQPRYFLMGVIYGKFENGISYKIFSDAKLLAEFLISPFFSKKHIFAHNAEFDLSGIFGNIYINLDKQAIFNGKFICARKNGVIFADSLNLLPVSLAKIGSSLNVNKGTDNERFINGEIKKYSQITQAEKEYCVQDCRILYQALNDLFVFVGKIPLTIGSASLYHFRNHYQKYSIEVQPLDNEFFGSYYGGRVECFKLGKTYSYKYDVNSLYPYIMRNAKFPNPKFLHAEKRPSIEKLLYRLEFYEGMAKCVVQHKDTYFGFLPVKIEGKLVFPTGRLSGCWNFNELRFALKHKVIEILSVEQIIYSNGVLDGMFTGYVDDLYLKRQQSAGFMKLVYKLMLNNLYGKFCQKSANEMIYFESFGDLMHYVTENEVVEYEIHMFNKKRIDCFLEVFAKKTEVKHTIACIGSYITSEARIYLLKHLLQYEKSAITYCDTDSIFCEKPLNINSLELGEFKHEPEIVTEIRGLKNYTQTNIAEYEGITFYEQKDKIKGINKFSIEISENCYENETYLKTKEAIRCKKESGTNLIKTKKVKFIYDKRIILTDNINTKPIFIT